MDDLQPEDEQQREDMLNKKYNAAVDEMETVAANFNTEVQAFSRPRRIVYQRYRRKFSGFAQSSGVFHARWEKNSAGSCKNNRIVAPGS